MVIPPNRYHAVLCEGQCHEMPHLCPGASACWRRQSCRWTPWTRSRRRSRTPQLTHTLRRTNSALFKSIFFLNPIFIKWYFLYCLSRFYRFYVALPLQTVNYYIALKVSKKIFSLSRHRFIYTFLYR